MPVSDVKQFTIKNYYPRKFQLDGGLESDSESVDLCIRRFNVKQLQEFQRGYERLKRPQSARFLFRKPDGDEQLQRLDGTTFVITDDEIRARREAEMSPEASAQYMAARDADDAYAQAFCSEAITAHIWLDANSPPLSVDTDDGLVMVKPGRGSGADLVKAFGGNLSFLMGMTLGIHAENVLSGEQKKALRSLSASTRSLPLPEGDGKTPAATATLAEPAGTVLSDVVSTAPALSRSGWTQVAG
jgi:hypothetical protein